MDNHRLASYSRCNSHQMTFCRYHNYHRLLSNANLLLLSTCCRKINNGGCPSRLGLKTYFTLLFIFAAFFSVLHNIHYIVFQRGRDFFGFHIIWSSYCVIFWLLMNAHIKHSLFTKIFKIITGIYDDVLSGC